ncbi:merR family regulatory protein [bacterium BMS3Bbin10]|nr:merR family regulatory protein [bacterium BMS3Bbin10]
MDKSPEAFRTISEVADDLDVPKHVLRFWEGKFSQLRPLKRGGGRRYYRPEDVNLLRGIRQLLYGDKYTIKGVQRILREQGVRHVMTCSENSSDGGVQANVTDIPDVAAEAARRAADQFEDGSGAEGMNKWQVNQLRALLAELEECKKLLMASKG